MATPQMHTPGPIITFPPNVWLDHLHLGIKREYPANTTLLHYGDTYDTLYFIQRGEVLISVFHKNEESSQLFVLRENSLLGLIGFFSGATPQAAWITRTDCTLYLFSREVVYTKLPREPLLQMLEQFGRMSGSMSRRITIPRSKRHEVDIAQAILHLIEISPAPQKPDPKNSFSFAPCITQEMLSTLLGMHPVTTNKVISKLREAGILGKFTKYHLEILNFSALQALAAGKA